MTQEEIIEGNKLIAEFMGLHFHKIGWVDKYYIDGNYECERLDYYGSWDWLIPVVEKIDQLKIVDYFLILFNHSSDIQVTNVKISDYDNNFYQHIKGDENTIDVVYKTTVEFIKWYNLKTK